MYMNQVVGYKLLTAIAEFTHIKCIIGEALKDWLAFVKGIFRAYTDREILIYSLRPCAADGAIQHDSADGFQRIMSGLFFRRWEKSSTQ